MNKILVTSLASLLLSGCLDDDKTNSEVAAFEGALFTTVSENFGSSDLVSVNADYQTVENLNPQAFSDIALSIGKESLYFINKVGQDNIVKYNQDSIGNIEWQYSTNNPEIANQNSNPYQVIEKSEESAYILRFNTGEIWQVNTTAESDVDFKITEIDLSAFDPDGIPEMVAGTIYNDILYVALQRLTDQKADQSSYLVAFDTNNNNSPIDLSPNDESTTALTLSTRNPKEFEVVGSSLYVASVGRYEILDPSNWTVVLEEPQYLGGIEKINLDTLESEVLVDDGDQENHPYGQIYSVSVFDNELVFTGYNSWGSLNTYIQIDDNSPIAFDEEINGLDIRFAKFDTIGQLWVGIGDGANPRTLVYTKNEEGEYEVVQTVLTTLLPNSILFK